MTMTVFTLQAFSAPSTVTAFTTRPVSSPAFLKRRHVQLRRTRMRRGLQMHTDNSGVPRRALLRSAGATAAAVCMAASGICTPAHAVPAARTVLNGVLSGYGLPNVADAVGTVYIIQQYGDAVVVRFAVPRAWVVKRALDTSTAQPGRSSGLTAGDYRRGEGVALYVADAGADVPNLVTPGDAVEGDADAVVVRDARAPDGARVLETTFETTTRSGYVVQRRALTRVIVAPDGRLYALSGSAVAERWRKVKPLMQAAIDSFEVIRI